MDSIHTATYKSGYWIWDNAINGLVFVSREVNPKTQSVLNVSKSSAKANIKQLPNELRFRETADNLEQIRFRRYHQRRCKPTEPQVVTIQDVKDVAIFMTNIKELMPEFINYFHTAAMDRFLRALIVYFQYYVAVWDNLMAKREEKERKLYQPSAILAEEVVRDDLSDLRAMVAREYCSIMTGAGDAKKFHHMSNKNNTSLSDKDRRLFETLICMAVRVVWIALHRKCLSLIELEMNRLLRTDIFNLIVHRGIRGGIDLSQTPSEARILTGTANTWERKLLHRSPIAKELILGNHDHRMLIIGTRQFEPTDERINYIEIAFSAPEEYLPSLRVAVGILGTPRDECDAMLMTYKRSVKGAQSSYLQTRKEFQMPPRVQFSDEKMPHAFPQNPPKYVETPQKIRARKIQRKMWQKAITKALEGREMSILDLSVSQSHVLLLTARSSISVVPRSEN